MTKKAPRTMIRTDDGWPDYAPAWARTAHFETWPGRSVLFEQVWLLPSQLRDVPNLEVLRVEQEWAADDSGRVEPVSPPRVIVGDRGEVWADARAGEVARTLREIADALDSGA